MLAFLLITAHLNAFANGRPPPLASPVPTTLAALKAQPAREFLDTGGAELEVDVQLKNSALRTEDVMAWVRKAAEAAATYYGRFPVRRARVSVIQKQR